MIEWQTSTQIHTVEARLARFGINIDTCSAPTTT